MMTAIFPVLPMEYRCSRTRKPPRSILSSITPAGRFVALLGHDLGEKDVLWVDYRSGVALHRVVTTNPREHRLRRLAATSPLKRRISYGCINVPAAFYDAVIDRAFAATSGVVYILPETRPIEQVFAGFITVN